MRINIYTNNKKIDKQLKLAINEYIKRNSIYCKISIDTLNKAKIKQSDYNIVIKPNSSLISSTELADKIKHISTYESSTINFILTDYDTIEIINDTMSISNIDINIDLLLVILTEQIYRAYTIINGKTYHK